MVILVEGSGILNKEFTFKSLYIMYAPLSDRVYKLLLNPYTEKLLMEYFRNPKLRNIKIIIKEVDENNLDIYETDENGKRVEHPNLPLHW